MRLCSVEQYQTDAWSTGRVVGDLSSSSYLVDSIRPVLCLQAEGAVLPVPGPALPYHRAIQEVGSVELDSWLAGRNLKDTSAGWVTHSEMT